jgi:hypothetical protein
MPATMVFWALQLKFQLAACASPAQQGRGWAHKWSLHFTGCDLRRTRRAQGLERRAMFCLGGNSNRIRKPHTGRHAICLGHL